MFYSDVANVNRIYRRKEFKVKYSSDVQCVQQRGIM